MFLIAHTLDFRDNPEDSDESTNPGVNWSTLQSLFLDDCLSHVLFLLDCCYAGSSARITDSTSKVEAIAAAGFEQVAPLRGSDSFTTFLTRVLKEIRNDEKTIVASVLARRISALLNSTDVARKDSRVTPRHFPLHNGKWFIEIGPLPEQPSGPASTIPTSPTGMAPKAPPRKVDASSSRDAQQSADTSPVWGFALADDHGSQRRRSPTRFMAAARTPGSHGIAATATALRTPSSHDRDIAATALFVGHPIGSRQIRVLNIQPCEETEDEVFGTLGTGKIFCTVETVNLPEKSADVPEPDYKALSWYCAQIAPWKAHITILPEHRRIPVPNELEAAFRDIRDPTDEIPVWVYQICIDRNDPDEVEGQTLLVPDIFRYASEVIIWPGVEDYSSDTALAFVPEVIDLRNIDDLVIGTPSPVPTPNSNATISFSPPPVYGLKQGTSTPPESSRTARNRPRNITVPRTPTKLRYTDSDVPEKWKSLVDFMTRPYFERRWAFLEVALARSANIYCGRRKLSWPGFCDAVTILGSRFEEVRLLLERPEVMGR